MTRRIDVADAQGRLGMLWLCGAAMIGLLLFVQTVTGKYGGQTARAWGWFFPTVIPTLTVIVTSWLEGRTRKTSKAVDTSVFNLAFGLSFAYIALVALTLLAQPFSTSPPLEFITSSSLWLGPVQGLVGIGVGRFFTSKSTS